MANTIKLKRGTGSDPSASDLSVGEVALRTDGNPKLFTKNDDGNVLQVNLQTASELLTLIKTVDGAGSGLNADTLDGVQSGSFVRSDQSDTMTGNLTLQNTAPKLNLVDTNNNSDYQLTNYEGTFRIFDTTNSSNRLIVNANGVIDIFKNLNCSEGIDVTGDLTVTSGGIQANSGDFIANRTDNDYSFVQSATADSSSRGFIFQKAGGGNIAGVFHVKSAQALRSESGYSVGGTTVINSGRTVTNVSLDSTTVTATTQSAGNNTTRIATTAFVSTAISNLVDSSPSTLNTLNELAAALGDDANFSTTVTNSIATKLPLAGGTLTGNLTISSNKPTIVLTEGDANPDYQIFSQGGAFKIKDSTNAADRLVVNTDGHIDIAGNLDVGAGIDVTGNITTTSGNLTVDGEGSVEDIFKISDAAGTQRLLMGNRDSAGVDCPRIFNVGNAALTIGIGDSWSGDGGTLTSHFTIGKNGVITSHGNHDFNAGIDVTGTITIGSNTAIFETNSNGTAVIRHADIHHAIIFRGTTNANGSTITQGNTTTFREYGDFVFRTGNINAQERFIIESGGTCKFVNNVEGSADENMAKFIPNGSVELYEDGSIKLTTSSTGVTVTGTCTATTFSGSGASLTNIPAGQLTGTLPALDGSNLTGVVASGSNANTLDNLDSTQFLRSDQNDTIDGILTIGGSSVSGNEGGEFQLTQSPNGTLSGSTVNFDLNGNNFRIFESGGNTRGYYLSLSAANNNANTKIWHEANDGSGSGLDSDLLDGVQGSSYLRSDAADTATGDITFSGGAGAVTVAAASDIRIAGGTWTGEYTGGIKIQPDASNAYIQYHGTLFFRDEGSTNNFQLTQSGGLTITGSVTANGGFSGSGANLTNVNATTLDSIDSGSFLRSDAADTMTGLLTMQVGADKQIQLNRNIATPANYYDSLQLEIKATSGTAGLSLHRSGDSHVGIYTDTKNVLEFDFNDGDVVLNHNTGTIWGSGNDGAGSGLNADTVDDIQASDFLRSDEDDSFIGKLTNSSRNEAPAVNHGCINLQPSANGGKTGIIFRSKINASSDFAYLWWYDDNNNYADGTNNSENGVLVVGAQNDASNSTAKDAVAVEASGDIFLNAGIGTGIGGANAPDRSKGKVYIGKFGSNAEVTAFPSGTRMIFQQTSAPTGWTKDTTDTNQRALRVVSGSVGSGGNTDFTSAFASRGVSGTIADTTQGGSIANGGNNTNNASISTNNGGNNTNNGGNNTNSSSISISVNNHTLSTAQMPSHTHTGRAATHDTNSASSQGYPAGNNHQRHRTTDRAQNNNMASTSHLNTGSTNSHNHGLSQSSHSHSINSHSHSINQHSHSIPDHSHSINSHGHTFTGSAHNHSFSGTSINMAVRYLDVIIAQKD